MEKISVIVPMKNNEKTAAKCLDSLLALDWPDYEVIVVNDSSTDSTGAILKEYAAKSPRVKVITTPGLGPSSARNLAVKEASGEFIASTDGDCIVEKGWLKELYAGFCDDRVGGIGGDQLSPADDSPFAKKVADYLKSIGFVTGYIKESAPDCAPACREVDHNPTCCVMYRKKMFGELGGFYPGLWPGEDVEFDKRVTDAGYKLLYNPSAVVYHYRSPDMKRFSKMMYSYGRVQSWLVRKFGFFRKIHYVPVALAVLLVGWILLLAKKPTFAVAAACAVALGAFLYFLKSARTLGKTFEFTLLFVVTVIFWNKGFFADMLGFDRRIK
jgi:glycosyltransferase involved in cell wall biosynthesis